MVAAQRVRLEQEITPWSDPSACRKFLHLAANQAPKELMIDTNIFSLGRWGTILGVAGV